MRLNLLLSTSTKPQLWHRTHKQVRVLYAELKEYNHLWVVFDENTWDVNTEGLIYTDPIWLKGLRDEFDRRGFSPLTMKGVCYSEQGLQGDDYVDLDITNEFIAEWSRLGFTV
jgi:hypothetical protein